MDDWLPKGVLPQSYIEAAEVMLSLSVDMDHLIDTVGAAGISGVRAAMGSTTLRNAVSKILRSTFKEYYGDFDTRREILYEHFDDVGAATRNDIARDLRRYNDELSYGLR